MNKYTTTAYKLFNLIFLVFITLEYIRSETIIKHFI